MAKRVNPAAVRHGATRTWDEPEGVVSGALRGVKEGVTETAQGLWNILSQAPELIGWLGQQAITDEALVKNAPAIQAALERYATPGNVRRIQEDWFKITPEKRQQYLNLAGEIAGGTAGAIAGHGAVSLPAAGFGAVAGKKIAEEFGPYLGASGAPERTAGESAHDAAKTFTSNALLEGVGRLAPSAISGAGRTGRNLIKRPFTPSAERAAINEIADRAGIDLSVAERSGRALPHQTAAALSYLPSSIEEMHRGGGRMMSQFEGALEGVGRRIHPAAVSPGDVSRVAKETLGGKRSALNAELEGAIPEYVSPRQAGEGYQASRRAALEDLRRLGSELYDPILKEYGTATIDMTEAGRRAGELLRQSVPEGTIEQLYPAATVDQLHAIGALRPKAPEGSIAIQGQSVNVSDLPPGVAKSLGIDQTPQPPTMTLGQLRELRTSLLERARRQAPNAPSLDRRTVHELIDTLNQAIESSDLPPEVIEQLSAANRTYSTEARRLFPPESRTGEGNLMARVGEGVEPEKIPGRIVTPGASKKVEDALAAATPRPGPSAGIGDFKVGSLHEQFLDPSRVETGPGVSRISPGKLAGQRRKIGPDAESALFGTEGPSRLDFLSSPSHRASELELYDSPMAKSIEKFEKKPRDLLHELAPSGHPERFQHSKEFLGDQGDVLARGFFDDIIESSKSKDRTLETRKPVTSPLKLDKLARQAGGSMNVALGDAKKSFDDLITVGDTIKEVQERFGNPSGTARMGQTTKAGFDIGRAIRDVARSPFGMPAQAGIAGALGGPIAVAASLGIPYGMAKVFTNPKAAKWLTAPLEGGTGAAMASPAAGVAARATGMAGQDDNAQADEIDWEQFRVQPQQQQQIDWEQFRVQ